VRAFVATEQFAFRKEFYKGERMADAASSVKPREPSAHEEKAAVSKEEMAKLTFDTK